MTEDEFMTVETGDAEGLRYAWKRYAVSLGALDPNHPIVRTMVENGDIEPVRVMPPRPDEGEYVLKHVGVAYCRLFHPVGCACVWRLFMPTKEGAPWPSR